MADNLSTESEDLPVFWDATQAINSGKPFQLLGNVKLDDIPQDKWHVLREALVQQSCVIMRIQTKRDVGFISELIRESKKLENIALHLEVDDIIPAGDIAELVLALQFSHIHQITLRRPAEHQEKMNISPILRGLKTLESLRTMIALFEPKFDELEALAQAFQNPRLASYFTVNVSLPSDIWPLIIPVLSSHPSLSSLDIQADSPNVVSEAFGEILSVNSSLKELILDVELTADGVTKLCSGLAKNTTLQKLHLGRMSPVQIDLTGAHITISGNEAKTDDEIIKRKIEEVLELNYAIDDFQFLGKRNTPEIARKLRRNRQLKSEAKFKVAILAHNIARSQAILPADLPREMWKSILSSFTYPGMPSFNDLVTNIFVLYGTTQPTDSRSNLRMTDE